MTGINKPVPTVLRSKKERTLYALRLRHRNWDELSNITGDPRSPQNMFSYVRLEHKGLHANHWFPHHRHQQYEFYMVERGRTTVTLGRMADQQVIIAPGEAVILAPDHAHSMEGTAPALVVNAHFSLRSSAACERALRRISGKRLRLSRFSLEGLRLLTRLPGHLGRTETCRLLADIFYAILLYELLGPRTGSPRK